jgi:glutamate dehydrogenase/leucine dehydrogenase
MTEVRAVWLPYGGAKGGVRCNPRELDRRAPEDHPALHRGAAADHRAAGGHPAPDMAANEQTMA